MGRIAGAPGGGRPALTHWAFALDDVVPGDRVALVLAPGLVARLPPLRGAALAAARGDERRARRRQGLAALVARLGLPDTGLVAGADGLRRLGSGALFASVAERAGWVAAVVSRTPVGIDLESVADAAASAAAVLDGLDFVDPAAWHGLAGIWAAREATLKALGRDLTTDPRGWRFGSGSVTPAGCPAHRIDLALRSTMIAAVAYVGG